MKWSRVFSKIRFSRPPEEIKYSFKTFGAMLVPVTALLLVLELLIPKPLLLSNIEKFSFHTDVFNFKTYLLYLVGASTHILVSGTILIILYRRLISNVTAVKRKTLTTYFFIFLVVMVILMLSVDALGLNLAILSHDRTYATLINSPSWAKLFKTVLQFHCGSLDVKGFYLFSIMPFLLISLGLSCIVITCLNLGRDLKTFLNRIKPDHGKVDKEALNEHLFSFQHYLHTLSFVLVTSTIATVLFLQLPATCIQNPDILDDFLKVSYGVGVCWGVTFSLTMLFMCFYPYVVIQSRIKRLLTDSEVAEDLELRQWLASAKNKYLIYNNLKSVLSIFAPAFVSLAFNFL